MSEYSKWLYSLEKFGTLSDEQLIEKYNEYQAKKDRIEYEQTLLFEEIKERGLLKRINS